MSHFNTLRFVAVACGLVVIFQNCGRMQSQSSTGDRSLPVSEVGYSTQSLAAASQAAAANVPLTAPQLMARLKFRSCMFEDLLSDAVPVFAGTFEQTLDLLARSNCESLPRAVETGASLRHGSYHRADEANQSANRKEL